MMNATRKALGAVAAALLAGLCWSSGASAQSGNPIKVGMSLALTGAGAPAGKMLQAAIEIWRDDVNAKGGLLGRPVEIIVYDDQSNPGQRAGPLHQAHQRRQSRPAARPLRHQLRRPGRCRPSSRTRKC